MILGGVGWGEKLSPIVMGGVIMGEKYFGVIMGGVKTNFFTPPKGWVNLGWGDFTSLV